MEREVILFLYFALLCILSVYGFHRYHLVYLLYKYKKNTLREAPGTFSELPKVTIQLPVFNELYVVERLIDSVAQIRYPKELLQIQVLDDSTDETVGISEKKVDEYKKKGFDIELHHRTDRRGFKAGALEQAGRSAKGEFIAIFDADFLPDPDFLEKTIHYFADPKVAVVQTRWGHLNRSYSLMTEVQAILLDGHFVIEHWARHVSGRFFNFNGTAGLWRKTAIEDGGGWQHDTLTEDLDLSFRTQLKGWKFIYLPHVVTPAELPIEVPAFKSQQHRWAKGAIQTGKKLLRKIWESDCPLKAKIEATFHLTNNVGYVFMFFFCILLLPALTYRMEGGWLTLLLVDFPLFMLATVSISSFYLASQIEIFPKSWVGQIKYLPLVTALGIGLCLNNAKAVMEALLGYKTGFVRTPKYNVKQTDKKSQSRYKVRANVLPFLELLFGIYFTFAVYIAFSIQTYLAIPFLFLFQLGYLYTGILSIKPLLGFKKAGEKEVEEGKEFFSTNPVQSEAVPVENEAVPVETEANAAKMAS